MGVRTSRCILQLTTDDVSIITEHVSNLGGGLDAASTPEERDLISCYQSRLRLVTFRLATGQRRRMESMDQISVGALNRLRVQNARLMEHTTPPAFNRSVGRGTIREPPVHSVVPRRLKTIEDVVQAWRRADPRKGSEYALRTIQTAADRKSMIRAYSNRWWETFGHRDCFSRYQKLVRELVSMLPAGRIDMREEGLDSDWEAALVLFHEKWDVDGKPRPLTTLGKLIGKENQT
jgi:hypothetical protein